jgi:hypothetical protein
MAEEPSGKTDEQFSELFLVYQKEPYSLKRGWKRIQPRLDAWRKSLSCCITLSALLHAALFGCLFLAGASASSSRGGFGESELRPFLLALAKLEGGVDPGNPAFRPLTGAEERELLLLLSESPLFDPSLSEEERAGLAEKLIQSYLVLKNEGAASGLAPRVALNDLLGFLEKRETGRLSSGDRFYAPGPYAGDESPRIYKLRREQANRVRWLRRYEKSEMEWTTVLGRMVKIQDEAGGIQYLPAEYYFRDCPYDEMLARGAGLFYAVEGFPNLRADTRAQTPERPKQEEAPSPLFRNQLVVYIIRPEETAIATSASPKPPAPFRIPRKDIPKILDELMPLPENRQFTRFVDEFLGKYDPESEDLASLTGEFIYNNLATVFLVKDPFPAAFDFLEELFYDKEFQGYFSSFWKKNPRTRTGSELLLALASLYDFERRTLALLFDSYLTARMILSGERRETDVYNRKAKAYVVKEVMEELMGKMDERGIRSEETLLRSYAHEQVKIFQVLVDLGGYYRNRALFGWGRLLWDEGEYGAAILKWRSIDSSYAYTTFQDIKHLISIYDSVPASSAYEGPPSLVPEINRILEWESSENCSRLYNRLVKFHKWSSRIQSLEKEASNYSPGG